MDMGITIPTNQTAGLFVDGINVLGGASSVSFIDISSVEVIRGPQPVYLGRGTFGGAINYTSITPGSEFSGGFDTQYSPTYGSMDADFYLEGALSEHINARLTGFTRRVGAAFTATDGGGLGEERTDGVSAIVTYEPTEKLKLKARLTYSEDDDGPPATTFVP